MTDPEYGLIEAGYKAAIFLMELMYKGPLITILLIGLYKYIKMLTGNETDDKENNETDGEDD